MNCRYSSTARGITSKYSRLALRGFWNMGIYGRYLRPGQIGEMSLIGFVLLMGSIWGGQLIAENPETAAMFTFSGEALALMLIAYGFVASVLPVWLLLAPRDYLSTFLKIGTIALLALAIFFAAPYMKAPSAANSAQSAARAIPRCRLIRAQS